MSYIYRTFAGLVETITEIKRRMLEETTSFQLTIQYVQFFLFYSLNKSIGNSLGNI